MSAAAGPLRRLTRATNRTRVRRPLREPLSAVQRAYLLDQELPPLTEWRCGVAGGDVWWLIVAAHQTDPAKAWYDNPKTGTCCSAIVLWARYRAALLPKWRRLHGRRRHPLERGQLPAVAERSAQARLAEYRAD